MLMENVFHILQAKLPNQLLKRLLLAEAFLDQDVLRS
jgi:hypothetical protein